MGRRFPINRESWQDNSYGIDKNSYDNEIDYMEAIEEAILDIDEEEFDYDLDISSNYSDEDYYDDEDDGDDDIY